MIFELEALIGRNSVVKSAASRLKHATVVTLNEEMAMVALTDRLSRELDATFGATPFEPPEEIPSIGSRFFKVFPALVTWAREVSKNGPVAYINAFGVKDWGGETAAVWREGKMVWGPEAKRHAINQALRILGVSATPETDEFHTVGLGLYVGTIALPDSCYTERTDRDVDGDVPWYREWGVPWPTLRALQRLKRALASLGERFRRLSAPRIHIRMVRGVPIVDLTGNCLNHPYFNLAEQVGQLLAAGEKQILINLTNTKDYCDATGLRNLVRANMICKNEGGELRLVNPGKKIHELLKLIRIDSILPVYSDEAEALASFKGRVPSRRRES